MSKYDITYNCGHEGTVAVFGKEKDRASKAEWMSHRLCPECAEAKRLADYAEASKIATEIANTKGLPALYGSEKQITWAMQIRQDQSIYLDKLNTNKPGSEMANVLERLAMDYMSQTSAKLWIDRRHTSNPVDGLKRAMAIYARSKGITSWEDADMGELYRGLKDSWATK